MNYIGLINNFWQLDEVWQFSSSETRLYFYLLKTANFLDWENNFWHSDAKTSVNNGMSINTLKSARNKIQQAGLIDFRGGGKGYGDKTRYQILTPNPQPKVQPNPQPKVQPNPQPLSKLNETKLNNTFSPDAIAPGSKKTVTLFWERLVKEWFGFYGQNFKNGMDPAEPVFNAAQGSNLKKIISHLQSLAAKQKKEWTEDYACYCLRGFLKKAWNHDEWMRNNFELGNLLTKFNSITNTDSVKNGTNTQKPGTSAERVAALRKW